MGAIMRKLSKKEKTKIQKSVEKNGNVRRAIAEHIYGEMVVFDCLGIPAFADHSLINEIEDELNQDALQGEPIKTEEAKKIDDTAAVNPETSDTEADKSKAPVEVKERTVFTDKELLRMIQRANKENKTLTAVIAEELYGESAFDEDGTFSATVNIHKVAYVKGLITMLLNSEVAEIELAEAQARPEPEAETSKPEITEAEAVTPEVTSEEPKLEVTETEVAKPEVTSEEPKLEVTETEVAKPEVTSEEPKPEVKTEVATPKAKTR